jgi:hypothetical protein
MPSSPSPRWAEQPWHTELPCCKDAGAAFLVSALHLQERPASRVSLAHLMLGDPNDIKNQGIFTCVPQIILPMYAVGYSCPHSPTRRQAVNLLLSTRRREGLWDATMAEKIVEWVVAVEEEFIVGEYVEEDMRMVKLTLKYDLMGG